MNRKKNPFFKKKEKKKFSFLHCRQHEYILYRKPLYKMSCLFVLIKKKQS
jgi:hypothetical protein